MTTPKERMSEERLDNVRDMVSGDWKLTGPGKIILELLAEIDALRAEGDEARSEAGREKRLNAGVWELVSQQTAQRNIWYTQAIAAEAALRLILPLAKAYAHEHPVGANQRNVEHAAALLAEAG